MKSQIAHKKILYAFLLRFLNRNRFLCVCGGLLTTTHIARGNLIQNDSSGYVFAHEKRVVLQRALLAYQRKQPKQIYAYCRNLSKQLGIYL